MELNDVLMVAAIVSGVLLIIVILLMLSNRNLGYDKIGTKNIPAHTLFYLVDANMLNPKGKQYRKAVIIMFAIFVLVEGLRILLPFI